MEITIIQAILICMVAFGAGLDFWLEGFFVFRPIIVAPLIGLILGDLQTGLIAGGTLELIFAGLTPIGGVQPPNPIMAAIMTVVIAKTTNTDITSAIALGFPFGLLMQQIIILIYSFNSVNMVKFDRYAREGDLAKVQSLTINTTLFVGVVYAVFTFLAVYLAQNAVVILVKMIPQWAMHGLDVAGGILPAVGFAMLLKILLKGEYVPYLLLGLVLIAYNIFPSIMPIAIIGGSLGALEFFRVVNLEKKMATIKNTITTNTGDDYHDGI